VTTAFVPYLYLRAEQRQEIHDWLRDHNVNPIHVPIDAQFERDDATGEWRIPVFWADRNGRHALDGEDLRGHFIRRRELRPLPWPTAEPAP
jgi:hypothetical protein